MAKEKWADIAGFDGVYQVSTLGRVRRSRPQRILQGSLQNGYPLVNLRKDGRMIAAYVHRLVAAAFLGYAPGDRGIHIHHKDGDRDNPAAENLEIIEAGEHGHRHYVQSCREIEPIGPGGGLTMFD